MIVTLLPLDRHVLAYTRAAQMAAWWVDCSVCLVAAPFGARLPIAATVGTFPTACSLGSSLPSAPSYSPTPTLLTFCESCTALRVLFRQFSHYSKLKGEPT